MRTLNGHPTTTAAWTAMRVAAGLAFWSHGAQKLFGWFGGAGPDGGTVALFSLYGAAGFIEVIFGALIVLGLFTRPGAFVASGHMAVAYFMVHVGGSGSVWWWENGGELAMVYSFIWLALAALGAGPWSLDGLRAQRAVVEPAATAQSRPRLAA